MKKTLKLFAGSQAVVWPNPDNGRTDSIHRACFTYAADEQEALNNLTVDIYEDCPSDNGFLDHSVSVMEVPGTTKEVEDGSAKDAQQ